MLYFNRKLSFASHIHTKKQMKLNKQNIFKQKKTFSHIKGQTTRKKKLLTAAGGNKGEIPVLLSNAIFGCFIYHSLLRGCNDS